MTTFNVTVYDEGKKRDIYGYSIQVPEEELGDLKSIIWDYFLSCDKSDIISKGRQTLDNPYFEIECVEDDTYFEGEAPLTELEYPFN
jgi:hypothetical protein